jgi:hypothetical protein
MNGKFGPTRLKRLFFFFPFDEFSSTDDIVSEISPMSLPSLCQNEKQEIVQLIPEGYKA